MSRGRTLRILLVAAMLPLLTGCVRIETSPTPSPSNGFSVTSGGCQTTGGLSISIVRETTQSFCVRGFSGTSWQLLNAVTEVEGSADYPDSFACRIDGWPAPEDNDCSSAASNFGYWNFFVTNTSLNWELAMEGAATHRPVCGSAEAWVWVSGPWTEAVIPPKEKPEAFFCPD